MIRSNGIRIALLFLQSGENATLSYQHGWPAAILGSHLFDCVPFNLAGRALADRMVIAQSLLRGRFDAVVLLHSVFSNQNNLRGILMWAVAACRAPKVFFIGNEYKHMPEKIRFSRRLGIDLLITQSNDERVYSLYRNALGCEVVCIPNTGIDPSLFRPIIPLEHRQIDIGYRSYASTWYLGNDEKSAIADWFLANAPLLGVNVDISLSPVDRFDAAGYAGFLNSCRGQIGTEAGGDYFELTDRTRKLVNAYTNHHPSATWPEIKKLFFESYGPSIPMRIISGRQVEAAACKTVQILFEGRYNEYLLPDQHYIPLKKDFSNVGEAMEKLADTDYCRRITDNAFDIAMTELTYDKLIVRFGDALSRVL